MGVSFSSKPVGFVGLCTCAVHQTDLKVMQKHFMNCTVILDHQYFFILLFLFFLNLNHA